MGINVNNFVFITKLVFSHINAQDIINCDVLFDNISYQTLAGYMAEDKEYYQNYSRVECCQMAQAIVDYVCDWESQQLRTMNGKRLNVFSLLAVVVNQLLKCEETVVCNYNYLIPWRELSRGIGEEIPVTAMYALTDSSRGISDRENFRWECVTKHSNHQLNEIMQRGISEHHFHLFASIPYFQVSWINLMNSICNNRYEENLCAIERQNKIPKLDDYIEKLINGTAWFDDKVSSFSIHRIQAAIIRFYLSRRLVTTGIQAPTKDNGYVRIGNDLYDVQKLLILLRSPEKLQLCGEDLQKTIESFYIRQTTDYLMEFFSFMPTAEDSEQCVFFGERWFMYSLLRDIYSPPCGRKLSRKEHNLFYAYLCLQNELRKEMVQINNRVGFDNFQLHEQRKGYFFLPSVGSQRLSARLAVREPLISKPYLREIEVRISPKDSARQNYLMIRSLDSWICNSADGGNQMASICDTVEKSTTSIQSKFYYVLHFIKRNDETTERLQLSQNKVQDEIEWQEYRHYRLRKRLERQMRAILAFRDKYPQTAARVRGIDAASQEIGCRAEVFAPTFRKLGNAPLYETVGAKGLPQLKKTYHAGEDFLDVIDGLRAVDEAIHFLNLDCGDRIGHAIALGTNVEEWYKGKNYQITLTVQDYIDNLAWMYHALIHYKLKGFEILQESIKNEFDLYFREVYLSNLDEKFLAIIMQQATEFYRHDPGAWAYHAHQCHFNIDVYYKAWCLRGDHPSLYKNGFYQSTVQDSESMKLDLVNSQFPKSFAERFIPECGILYFSYHYNPKIKVAGRRKIIISIGRDYIKACAAIQKCMQFRVAHYGIAIETNPSSNVLIGTFREYAKHPLYNFYNKQLAMGPERDECAQLNISINTDDNGVFYTSLENEFALIARATELVTDDEGKPVYKKTDIYDWLDSIRRMGNEQGF